MLESVPRSCSGFDGRGRESLAILKRSGIAGLELEMVDGWVAWTEYGLCALRPHWEAMARMGRLCSLRIVATMHPLTGEILHAIPFTSADCPYNNGHSSLLCCHFHDRTSPTIHINLASLPLSLSYSILPPRNLEPPK